MTTRLMKIVLAVIVVFSTAMTLGACDDSTTSGGDMAAKDLSTKG